MIACSILAVFIVMVIYLKEDLSGTEDTALNTIWWIAVSLIVISNLISCWALVDSFRRMISSKGASKNLVVNYKMMTAHVVSYAIFIFALFLYFLSLSGIGNKAATSVLTDSVAVFSVLSQGLLMLIFVAITKQAKASKIKSQTLLQEDESLKSSV